MRVTGYVHGYTERENRRLHDQASTLGHLFHDAIRYEAGRRVLEIGCGTGAQTMMLAANSPHATITSIDISPQSVELARARVEAAGHRNVTFYVADLFNLAFEVHSFDDLFVCFVLEHLTDPLEALQQLRRLLRPGGTITSIEGDHGSFYCHPHSPDALRTVQCLIEVQQQLGCDPLIGRRLSPLLREAGFGDVRVSPLAVYVDGSRPDLVEGFSRDTFIAMVEGVRAQALRRGLIDETRWEQGIADLYKATLAQGTFNYTFFRATGTN